MKNALKNIKKYFKTIRFRIFITYAVIIILMVFVLSLLINFYVFNRFQENAYQALRSTVETQLLSVEKEIESMDSLSLNILTSHIIKDYLKENSFSEINDSSDDVKKVNQISAQLSSLVVPSFTVPRAMLHDFKGRSFTSQSGYYKEFDVKKMTWYKDTLEKNGLMYLTIPYDGNDETMSTDIYNIEKMLSLCRVMFDGYQRPKAIVEVVQYCKRIFGSLDRLSNSNAYLDIAIYNEKGNRIYPYESKEKEAKSYLEILETKDNINLYEVQLCEEKIENENVILGVQKSNEFEWTIVLVSSKKMVMRSINDYFMSLIISALIGVLLALIISFFASRQISAPILSLGKRMQLFNITELEPEQKDFEQTSLTEIEDLNQTFFLLSTHLKESVREKMLAHQHELQYKMLALQSQMNPHFLYNSLAVISAMAEEGLTEDISYACKKLSLMLRYIASGKGNIVTVEAEIEHTVHYLEFMKLRFKDKLQYEIDIPEELMQLEIPKLSIQPLVENSVKFCSLVAPPWFISVKGEVEPKGWTINIKDNGIGINQQAKDELLKKIKQLDEEEIVPTLELDGMGLKNVYIRLKLLFKDQMIFSIKEVDSRGTEISIGTSNSRIT